MKLYEFLRRWPIPADWSDERRSRAHRELTRIARVFPGVLAKMCEIPRANEEEGRNDDRG